MLPLNEVLVDVTDAALRLSGHIWTYLDIHKEGQVRYLNIFGTQQMKE
jgi:hypothetical protein